LTANSYGGYVEATEGGEAGTAGPHEPVRLTAWVSGRVQGVGFRWWTRSRALEQGLVGWARNAPDGRVEVVTEGNREACDRLLAALRGGSAPGRVDDIVVRWSAAKNDISSFRER
jgi:acylphosphatase